MKSLILIGEAPGGKVGDPPTPDGEGFTSQAGRNLCTIAGWDWERFLEVTDRRNLFDRPVDRWDGAAARRNATRIVRSLGATGTPVLILGSKVAGACNVAHWPNYEWRVLGDAWRVTRIPHPSGLNRMWNDPAERERAREFLEDLVR